MDLGLFLMVASGVLGLAALAVYLLIHQNYKGRWSLITRGETIAVSILLSGLLLFGNLVLKSKVAAKPPSSDSSAAATYGRPTHGESSASTEDGDVAAVTPPAAVGQNYTDPNARPAPTFDDVMTATSHCRSSTATLLNRLRARDVPAAEVLRIAEGASAECNDGLNRLAKLALAEPAKDMCNRVIWSNQSLASAVIGSVRQFSGNAAALDARESEIRTTQSNCDLSLRP